MGVLDALKVAAGAFHEYAAHHAAQAQVLGEVVETRMGKALANQRLAMMCERAAAGLEAMLADSFQRAADRADRKPAFGPIEGFASGWGFRAALQAWLDIPQDDRPAVGPPATLDDAMAYFRAQLAQAGR